MCILCSIFSFKQEAHGAFIRSHDSTCNVIVTKLTLLGIFNLDPKACNWILFDLQTEHASDKACYEDDKYQIGFILTWYLKEG